MKIIKQRERITNVQYWLDYKWKDDPNAGFAFDCDEKGNLLKETSKENYEKCNNGTYNVIFNGIVKHANTYTESAIGLCNVCNNKVYLDGFTNTCEICNTDYNMSGQQLACREQWGEETGEYLSDILRIK